MNEESSILFLGDVVPYKTFRFRNGFKTVINLECPITQAVKPVSGKVSLSVGSNHLPATFGKNLFAVNLSNNHMLDYGIDGLISTMREVEKSGAGCFGINFPEDNSHNPLITRIKNKDVAFISAVSEHTTPLVEFDDFNYLSLLDTDELISRIGSSKNMAGRVVVYIHWGTPESSYPDPASVEIAHKLIDAGADVVIGSHAHAPQAVEKYKAGIIAYNLGNFIMPAFRNTPSFYDEDGVPQSSFSKRLMLWNRISWGLLIDMDSLDYEIRKYVFMADFIVQVKSTPLDRYLSLQPDSFDDSYRKTIRKHVRNRKFRRNVINVVYNPLRRYF